MFHSNLIVIYVTNTKECLHQMLITTPGLQLGTYVLLPICLTWLSTTKKTVNWSQVPTYVCTEVIRAKDNPIQIEIWTRGICQVHSTLAYILQVEQPQGTLYINQETDPLLDLLAFARFFLGTILDALRKVLSKLRKMGYTLSQWLQDTGQTKQAS